MVKETKIIIGCVVVMALVIVFGISDRYPPEKVDAKDKKGYSMNYISSIEGAPAQLWQDSNGCYWMKDSDGYKQIFKNSRNTYSDTQPYCE